MFDEYERDDAEAAGKIFLGSLFGLFFAGWILFLTYNAFRPDVWPYLGLWTAFGASYLFTYAVAKVRGV